MCCSQQIISVWEAFIQSYVLSGFWNVFLEGETSVITRSSGKLVGSTSPEMLPRKPRAFERKLSLYMLKQEAKTATSASPLSFLLHCHSEKKNKTVFSVLMLKMKQLIIIADNVGISMNDLFNFLPQGNDSFIFYQWTWTATIARGSDCTWDKGMDPWSQNSFGPVHQKPNQQILCESQFPELAAAASMSFCFCCAPSYLIWNCCYSGFVSPKVRPVFVLWSPTLTGHICLLVIL